MEATDKKITLKLQGGKKYTTSVSDIVCIESIPYNSNNKTIYFKKHKAEVLVNFSSRKDIAEKLQLTDGELVEVGRGIWVNAEHVEKWRNGHRHLQWKNGTCITVNVINGNGTLEENHRCYISRAAFSRIKKFQLSA